MERAAITPITMRREVIRASHHAITGSVISSLPLKIVAITASPTEIARTAIDLASAIPIAGMVPGLASTNQVCANLTSSITMSTRATRIDLARLVLVQPTHGIPIHARKELVLVQPTHGIPIHARKDGDRAETREDAILSARNDHHGVQTAITGSLVNSIVRLVLRAVLSVTNGPLAMDHSLIHTTHAGRAGRTNFRADLKNPRDSGRTLSSSRAITSALMLPTLLRVPPGSMQIRANAMQEESRTSACGKIHET